MEEEEEEESIRPQKKKQKKMEQEGGADGGEGEGEEAEKTVTANEFVLPPLTKPPSLIERDFKQYFALDRDGISFQDQYIYQHHNKLCVVGLAPTHPVRTETLQIKSIDFNVGGFNRLTQQAKGKGKKNAVALTPEAALCKITCENGSEYMVRSCLKGILIEVNESLMEMPKLIQQEGDALGYVAVIKVRQSFDIAEMFGLVSLEDYQERKLKVAQMRENAT